VTGLSPVGDVSCPTHYEIGVAAMVTPILSLGFAGQNPMLVKTADKKQHHSANESHPLFYLFGI
jgi:hypothetical protein